MAEVIQNAILRNLETLESMPADQLLEDRQRRVEGFGVFNEA